MTPSERQNQITQELLLFEDPQERLSFVQDRMRRVPPMPADMRTEGNRIQGCATPVWLSAAEENGRIVIQVDSTSAMVRGLASLLAEVYSGSPAAEILAFHCTVLAASGLERRITPTRLHGLLQVQAAIHALARECSGNTPL